jgi:hypothetical protein
MLPNLQHLLNSRQKRQKHPLGVYFLDSMAWGAAWKGKLKTVETSGRNDLRETEFYR